MSWDSDEISARNAIAKEYGLRRRKEILIAQEILRNFRRRAKELNAEKNENKKKILIGRLVKMGLLGEGKGLDDVLAMSIKNIFERRLQTIVWKKGLAITPRQARQYIAHGLVSVNGKKVKSPSYIVPVTEEPGIMLAGSAAKGGK